MSKSKAAVFSPFAVIGIGLASAYLFRTIMQEWAFVPLAFIYWGVTFAIAYTCIGKAGVAGLFAKPERNILAGIFTGRLAIA